MSKRHGTAFKFKNKSHEVRSGLFKAALRAHQSGNYDDAERLYRRVIAENPNHAFALSNLGSLARRNKQFKEAIALQHRAIKANPKLASSHNNLGNALFDAGLAEAAQDAFRKALSLNANYVDAKVGIARAFESMGDNDAAIGELTGALKLDSSHVAALALLGGLLLKRHDYAAAVPLLQRVLDSQPNHVEALNNLGCIFSDLGQPREARIFFERAVKAEPKVATGHYNLGNMVRDLLGAKASVVHFEQAVALDPKYVNAWFNMGSVLTRIDKAASNRALDETLKLQPYHVGALISRLMVAEKDCSFAKADELYAKLEQALTEGGEQQSDWTILGNIVYNEIFRPLPPPLSRRVTVRIDQLLLERAARQGALAPFLPVTRAADSKLRLGYISPNFRNHPVGHVTLSLFRSHDRERFEVHGFSTATLKDDPSTYAVELRQGFDTFHEIGSLSSRDAAQAIRDARIDVLVDLDGYMENKSPPILSFRPAPVQVYWLGHAGGLGLSFVDYLVADEIVIPKGKESLYRERVARLPEAYHCADRAPISHEVPSRSECGLPDSGFVFCAFNNPQKIDAQAFECWMRILQRVDRSCLWLSNPQNDAEMVHNVQSYAERLGVATERIVFATRIEDKAIHLGRHRHAGLFLDTTTLNASTTALDALWAGVPVLTVAGSRFASRIATTMLTTLGLMELVSRDLADYEERAVAFAQDSAKLGELAARLNQARLTQPLFDIERFVRHLEQAIEQMWAAYQRGEPPRAFDLDKSGKAGSTMIAGAKAPATTELRLHIGGREVKAGWQILNVQAGPNVDYVGNCHNLSAFADGSVEEVYASHVYEHLGFRSELPEALREAHRVLKSGGLLRISVPDMEVLCRLFVDQKVPRDQRVSLMMHLFGAQEDAYDFHRVGLTEEFLSSLLKQAGFARLRRVEQFGIFNDFSSFRRFGVLISLNMEAWKA